jgi:preprotein translocase subunit SecD
MSRNLRWKLVVILTLVIGTSAFAWVPPLADRLGLPLPGFMAERRLSLGLDLRGGVQFVLRVNAQEALDVDASLTRDEESGDWKLSGDQERLYVTMPKVGQVAVVNTGPGVIWPTVIASRSCSLVSQW